MAGGERKEKGRQLPWIDGWPLDRIDKIRTQNQIQEGDREILSKWGREKEGIWRAIAQEKEGKAMPALEERGLCPKRKKMKNDRRDQHRTECHNLKFPFPGCLGTIPACSRVPP